MRPSYDQYGAGRIVRLSSSSRSRRVAIAKDISSPWKRTCPSPTTSTVTVSSSVLTEFKTAPIGIPSRSNFQIGTAFPCKFFTSLSRLRIKLFLFCIYFWRLRPLLKVLVGLLPVPAQFQRILYADSSCKVQTLYAGPFQSVLHSRPALQ